MDAAGSADHAEGWGQLKLSQWGQIKLSYSIGLGHAVGHALGSLAEYVAAVALIVLGGVLFFAGDDDEGETASALGRARGLALVGLGLSVSVDELAIGFSAGLLHLPLVWTIGLIAVQAFVVAQLGIRLGTHVREQLRERIETAAALALIALGLVLLGTRIVA